MEDALSTCLDTSLNSIAGVFSQTRDAKRQNSGNIENDRFPPQRLPGSPEDSACGRVEPEHGLLRGAVHALEDGACVRLMELENGTSFFLILGKVLTL